MGGPIVPTSPAISIDRADPRPLFAQIAAALEERLAQGQLQRGARLPTVRDLAATLGVNRATVQRAYRELEGRGLIAARVGSGTVVIADPAPAATGSERTHPRYARGILDLERAAGRKGSGGGEQAIDFAMLLPDVSLFPRPRLASAVEAALSGGDEVLQYGAAAGLDALRKGLAERLSNQRIEASAEDVLIVNGVQQALDLLGKVLLEPGDAVIVESPTYANVLPLLALHRARPVPVPIDDDGLEPDGLRAAIERHRPKLLYTMPSHQNPTAVSMSPERRRQVLEVCARYDVVVVEDGSEEELHYTAEPPKPLAAHTSSATVVHLGTFSKGLFPGLRLGHVVAHGDLFELLVLAKRYSDYHADLLSQAVAAKILSSGDYDRHLAGLRRTYGARMRHTVKALGQHLPRDVRLRPPSGGYKLWLELPDGVRASEVADAAARRGVAVLTGEPFFTPERAADGQRYLRLSISRTDPERIEDGAEILGAVITEAMATQRPLGRDRRRAETPLI